jgi:hypothetical protein
MNRAVLLMSLLAPIALLGCGKSSEAPAAAPPAGQQAAATTLELAGVALGRPLGSAPLAERLKKTNPIVGPQGDTIGGSQIIFSRVQLDAAKNVEVLYLKFDEEDYEDVKRALAERYPMDCKSGKVHGNTGRVMNDELCVHTGSGGSLALRRRDQRADISSVGIISEALGKPQLEGLFTDEEEPLHKGT